MVFVLDFSALIHECYSAQCANPVHIVVDTNLTADNIDIRGFVSSALVVDGRVLASVFDDVAVSLTLSESEVSCLNLVNQHQIVAPGSSKWETPTVVANVPSSRDQVLQGLDNIIGDIDRLSEYVDDIIAGRREPNADIAEAIEHTIAALTQSKQSGGTNVIDAIVTKQHDLTMVAYLSTLVQAQVVIAGKINAVL